jgi:N utilization substance protein A
VQAVVAELQGEKIDIIPWSPDPATFVVNALAPAEVTKIVLDEDQNKIEVVVPDDQLSLAIGRRGQNVRLASMLTGWDIDILTEEEESERRQKEFLSRSKRFIEALDIDDVIAHLLVTEGFSSVEEVAYVPVEDVAEIEGFDEELAGQLQLRARNFLEAESVRLTEQRRELGVTDELAALPGLTLQMLVKLGEKEIKTLEDFADLASDELTDAQEGFLASFEIRESEANELIMKARVAAGWFTEEELLAAEREKLEAEELAAAQAEGAAEAAAHSEA